ncbi:glycosyltransferase family 2 protein [bacterium]|nr:glycosyltransferase family 2 protein [bacterium]
MNKPFVSVILPIRNEEKSLVDTLSSIVAQDYGLNNFEIIVSDGMSSDNSLEIIRSFQKKFENIFLIENPGKIVPTGFNLSLNISKGEIIVRVDGHTIISKNYISRCVELLLNKNASNVGGLINPLSDKVFGKLVALATSSRFGVGNSYFHFSKEGKYVDTVYLGAWKRDVFKRIGGFDEELIRNQDDEFNFRLIQSGGKIWLDPSIKSFYTPRLSFLKLFKQYFQYGFYKVRVIQKRRDFSSYRHLVPSAFVLFTIMSIFFLKKSILPLLAIIIPYTSAALLSTLICSINYKDKNLSFFTYSLVFLPLIFLTLHVSYGLGSIFGFLYFFNKMHDTKLNDNNFNFKKFERNEYKLNDEQK